MVAANRVAGNACYYETPGLFQPDLGQDLYMVSAWGGPDGLSREGCEEQAYGDHSNTNRHVGPPMYLFYLRMRAFYFI